MRFRAIYADRNGIERELPITAGTQEEATTIAAWTLVGMTGAGGGGTLLRVEEVPA